MKTNIKTWQTWIILPTESCLLNTLEKFFLLQITLFFTFLDILNVAIYFVGLSFLEETGGGGIYHMWLVVGQKVTKCVFCVLCVFVFFYIWSLLFTPACGVWFCLLTHFYFCHVFYVFSCFFPLVSILMLLLVFFVFLCFFLSSIACSISSVFCVFLCFFLSKVVFRDLSVI